MLRDADDEQGIWRDSGQEGAQGGWSACCGAPLHGVDDKSNLFKDLAKRQEVLLTHGDSIDKVADIFKVVGTSGNLVTAIANEKTRLYELQFHPEVGSWLYENQN